MTERTFISERAARAAAHDAHRDTCTMHHVVFLGSGLLTIRPEPVQCRCLVCKHRRVAAYRRERRAAEVA